MATTKRRKPRVTEQKPRRGEQDHRLVLQPKLRMIANGSNQVNLLRAEQISALTVKKPRKTKALRADAAMEPLVPRPMKVPPKLSAAARAKEVFANVFVELKDDSGSVRRVESTASRGRQVAGRVSIAELRALAADPKVAHVELAEALNDPRATVATEFPSPPQRKDFGPAALDNQGENVLIGIIDVQGFDFAHRDFSKAGKTRFVEIWDQGGSNRARRPKGYDYGSVITQEQMNRAIREAPRYGAPATELEPQSQMVVGSHGTHVASIAAGNTGVCPKAEIAAVLVAMGPDDGDARTSFYDSTRIIHAVDYLLALAERRGLPISINVSLGTNGHAHDGSSAPSRWIDALLTAPGRAVCVAAGNAGQERAERAGDQGWVMGRIHTSGRIPAPGLSQDVGWIVVGNGIADVSENELEFWYSSQDRFAVSVRTPDGTWTRDVEPGQYIENEPIGAGGTMLSVYNERYHRANGANYISVYLSPPLVPGNRPTGVAPGLWTVRLRGIEVRDGSYHGWIERDDPRPLGMQSENQQLWNFPSFFEERANVDRSSIGSLACGHAVVAVANLDELNEKVNITSSQGPTRDGRNKPDVCAPGTDVIAAKGFAGDDDPWIAMTGTSMASPHVAGVIGLMLSAKPTLTAAQILGLLRRTARPLPGSDYAWRDDAGYGRVVPADAVSEAKTFEHRKEVPR